jgi:hypothetical protein
MVTNLRESGMLCLGTANFGSNYGIANESEGIAQNDVKRIFEILNKDNLIALDTASNYPKSEEIIGEHLYSNNNKINTKIGSENYSNPNLMVESVKKSLLKTKRNKFNTIYLHGGELNHPSHKESIIEGLSRIRELGFCETLGVSCYTENEVLEAVVNYQDIQAFQVPENILDQRLIHSAELMQLSNTGIKFEVRSIFLQGSMLMEASKMPKSFENYGNYFNNVHTMANSIGITVFDLALLYALSIPWKSSIVVGVNSFQQFEELISFNFSKELVGNYEDLKAPEELIDPRRWKSS